MVETNYQNSRINEIDVKRSVNPLFDRELETIANDTTIKIESDRFDSGVPNYETIFISSFGDDSNRQIVTYNDEKSSTTQKPVADSNPSSAANPKCTLLEVERKKESVEKSGQSTISKQMNTIKISKSTASESNSSECKGVKETTKTIEGSM